MNKPNDEVLQQKFTMNPRCRQLPSRDTLKRVDSLSSQATSDLDVAGVDVVLHLLRTADIIRYEVYSKLYALSGLSEGKLTLLLTLRSTNAPMTIQAIAESLGVAAPTISIMIKRMLREPRPLITRLLNPSDKRSVLIALSEVGIERINEALPTHLAEIARFSAPLDNRERNTLVDLLKKLAGPLPTTTLNPEFCD